MVAHRDAGEPHLARRGRLRHRRRLDRHHDGEHLPPPGPARQGHDAPSASCRRRARWRPPMSFSTLIIGVAFLPLFTMTGVVGRHLLADGAHLRLRHRRRHPARADAHARARVASSCPRRREEKEQLRHARAHQRVYDAALRRSALRAPEARARARRSCPSSSCVALVPAPRARVHAQARGGQLLDPRDAAHVDLARAVGASTSAACARILRGCPEDESVAVRPTRTARTPRSRPSSRSSAAPTTAPTSPASTTSSSSRRSSPFDEWPQRPDQGEAHRRAARASCARPFPGVIFNFSQMITDNVEEAMSGVKGENSVKVFGPDLAASTRRTPTRSSTSWRRSRASRTSACSSSLGQPNVRITPDRARVRALRPQHRRRRGGGPGGHRRPGGHAGLRGREALRPHGALGAAVPQGRSRRSARSPVSTPDGAQVPLGQIAQIVEEEGPSLIYREDGQPLHAGEVLACAGATSAVDDRRGAGEDRARRCKLPYDTHLEWAGEINELNEADGPPRRSSSRSRCCSSRSSSTRR